MMIEGIDPLLTLAGFLVGIFIGVCGVGGGALMTPFLIFYGTPPVTAVGTDLLYAAITKIGGVIGHHRQGSIVWSVVITMLSGSVPASIVTLYILNALQLDNSGRIITIILAAMLLLTAIILFIPKRERHRPLPPALAKHTTGATLLLGMVIGTVVTITSVGAGALGVALLVLLYPQLPMVSVVGSDIAHAFPLALVASLGHLQMGNIDMLLLGMLLIGSLPGVLIGSKYSGLICDRLLRRVLAFVLLFIAVGLII